jgi:hypothetical protein
MGNLRFVKLAPPRSIVGFLADSADSTRAIYSERQVRPVSATPLHGKGDDLPGASRRAGLKQIAGAPPV